jgi:uncharacterized OB-fold protein
MSARPRQFSPYDAPLWDSIAAGALQLPRCTRCQAFHYPPGPCCPECLSFDLQWQPVSGQGRVLSWTTFHRDYLPAWPAPHTVVAVQLQEGPIMIGHVPRSDAKELALDAPVTIAYTDHADGYRITEFRLGGTAA